MSFNIINLITIFFIYLILYQLFLAFFNEYYGKEAFDNVFRPYDATNPNNNMNNMNNMNNNNSNINSQSNAMILAQQNAGNISVLKQEMDSLLGLKLEVKEVKKDITNLQEQMNQMVMAQQQYTTQMTGGKVPNITGDVSK